MKQTYTFEAILFEREGKPAQPLEAADRYLDETQVLLVARTLLWVGRLPLYKGPHFEAVRVLDQAGSEVLRWDDQTEADLQKREAAEKARQEAETRKELDG